MTPLRALRILAFAVGFFVAFHVSQAATVVRSPGETVPGIHFAVGALAVFFLIGAYATEQTKGSEQNVQKDMLWGLGSGGLAILANRLLS